MKETRKWAMGVFAALVCAAGSAAGDDKPAAGAAKDEAAPNIVLQCSCPDSEKCQDAKAAPAPDPDAAERARDERDRLRDERDRLRDEREQLRQQREELLRLAQMVRRAETPTPQEAPPGPWPARRETTRRFSRGLLATGIVFTSLGGVVLITSIVGALGTHSYDDCFGTYCGHSNDSHTGWWVAMGVSGAAMVSGIAMTAVGAVKIPIAGIPAARVKLDVGPTFAGISGTF